MNATLIFPVIDPAARATTQLSSIPPIPAIPMPSFFIYTLGPVQDFIAAAKRCRDLWFGSWLLSELSKAAAQAVANFAGVSHSALIFPHVADPRDLEPGSDMSVANKIVAELPDGVPPDAVALACRQAIAARLQGLRDEAFDLSRIDRDAQQHLDRPLTDRQLDELIEAQWVSVPYADDHYAEARQEAEQLLASAKHTRLWEPVKWATARPKSSVDGLRESVIDEQVHASSNRSERLRGRLGLDEREHLCGVGMLKRHGRRLDPREGPDHSHKFFSTPHLAAGPLLDRIRNFDHFDPETTRLVEQRWTTYLKALKDRGAWLDETVPPRWHTPILGGHDGQLLFEGRVAERFEHLDEKKCSEAVKDVLPSLRALLDTLGSGPPSPYIAILVADGDRMGDAIGRQSSPEGHRQLSAALDGFSRSTRQIVEDTHGQLIYAGGDDVLAFVPLHRAIDCAQALRLRFAEALAAFGDNGSSPTLSVGIGICHFMQPLTHSLNVARDAEQLAKRKRNSLAIIVDKRSGAPISVCGTWDDRIDETLKTLIKRHLDDEVPDKLAHDLNALARLQAGPAGEDHKILARIAAHEFKHLLRQKRGARGQQPLSADVRAHLAGQRSGTAAGSDPPPLDPDLASQLLVAQIFARAQQAATPGHTS